jgi:hypothetical protein
LIIFAIGIAALVTEIATHSDGDGYDFSMFLVLVGVLIIVGGIGILVAVLANEKLTKPATTFTVVLTTASGEVAAYQSEDREHISQIVKALNDSIVARG